MTQNVQKWKMASVCSMWYSPNWVSLYFATKNDYPFPYKICIDVAGADQSTIDNIRRVGGSVSITYRDRVNLRAHIKPYKFEVLPKMARPNLQMVHYLEKMRARGCSVHYIMPLWLLEEYKKLETDLLEFRDTDEKRTKYFTLIESVHPTTWKCMYLYHNRRLFIIPIIRISNNKLERINGQELYTARF